MTEFDPDYAVSPWNDVIEIIEHLRDTDKVMTDYDCQCIGAMSDYDWKFLRNREARYRSRKKKLESQGKLSYNDGIVTRDED